MRILLLCLLIIGLTACAKQPRPQQPSTATEATVALAESAASINHSLIQLNATEQAANPPLSVAAPPNPASYGMAIPASLDWTGPAEPAIKQIAIASDYKFKVTGTKPSMPVLVSVHQHNSTLGSILRNIGLQCKRYAQVIIYPKSKIIELRYTESS